MKILRTILQIFGMLFLAAVVAAVGMYFYAFHASTEKVNQATENQARFVLNWGGLNAKQNYSVVFSHESRNGFLPDHLIYYCLQLSEFSIDEHHREEWKAGPETNPVFSQAIETAANSVNGKECFTQHGKANSKEVQAFFWSVRTNGRFPSGAQVLLYEPSSRRLLYVDYET
jgi:hypothetical protein